MGKAANNKQRLFLGDFMKTLEIFGNNYFGHWENSRTACRGIIIKDGCVLLSYETMTGQYMIPGGGLEEGEDERECCTRELAEETGFLVSPSECVLEQDVGMEPRWLPLDEIIGIFGTHADYTDTDEMRRGIYLREFTVLKALEDRIRHPENCFM